MSQTLIIVESPTKAKTVKKFLGKNYKVEATLGHLRDLPKSQLGVDIENDFEPKYITIRGKGDVMRSLKKEAKNSKAILLATDPDREGEAISWHLAQNLNINLDEPCRIEFNEITKTAIKNAVKKPREIDMDLVGAQQARRVLDRIVGYKISPLLWRKVSKGLSAGRVQSVATRIICEREKEIDAFVPEEYWSLTGEFSKKDQDKKFEASFYSEKGKRIKLVNEEQTKEIISNLKNSDYIVDNTKETTRRRNSPAPFTTSTLQQDASRKLGFTAQKTMIIAQQLYEGIDIKGEGTVGLITYMRTDSTRISDSIQTEALNYIENKYGKEYRPEKPNQYRSRRGAQDAHEAIRPTSLREPKDIKSSLNKDQYRLYNLIYQRFLASQMTAAKYKTLTIDIKSKEYIFRASGSIKVFAGFTIIYTEGKDDNDKDEGDIELPKLVKGDLVNLEKWLPKQHFTKPPARYTEASLISLLEKLGIGRPSTYSPTIYTITNRGYVRREKRTLIPTELGFIVNDLMTEYFSQIVDYKFTADMEDQLDKVEEGSKFWKDVIRDFYPDFKVLIDKADESIEKIEIEDEVTDVICEKCGANMVIKTGRFGKFLACPNFPECRNTKPIIEKIDVPCPKCKSPIVKRRSKKGRVFYGCSAYPDCDFISWDIPVNESCEKCGSYMVEKKGKENTKNIVCSDNKCGNIKVVN